MKKAHNFQSIIKVIIIGFGGCLIVNLLSLALPAFWNRLITGKNGFELIPTFQDSMWVMFFIGCLILYNRYLKIKKVKIYQGEKYLPEEFDVIIDDMALTDIIKKTKIDSKKEDAILPYMILQICLQFRTNNSISLTTDFLAKQMDLFLHEIELGYNKIKYIIWLIPSLGFMGTVYGIGLAVSQLGVGTLDDPQLLTNMAGSLGIAFNTTLIALVLSVILQFFSQLLESKEEGNINQFGKYILDYLINKIIEKK